MVAELADAMDSKSIEGNLMGVRLSPAAHTYDNLANKKLGDGVDGGFCFYAF